MNSQLPVFELRVRGHGRKPQGIFGEIWSESLLTVLDTGKN
jgi:hypothetical protein